MFHLLLITHRNFGDVVKDISLIPGLKKAYPKSQIDVLTSPVGNELLEGRPDVSNIFIFDKAPYRKLGPFLWRFGALAQRLTLVRKLRKKRYHLIINVKTASILSTLLAGDQKITFQPLKTRTSTLNHMLDELSQHNIHINKDDLSAKIAIQPNEKKEVAFLLQKFGFDFNRPAVAIFPYSNWHAKEWPVNNIITLSKKLNEKQNMQPVFLGTTESNESISFPLGINLIGKTTPRLLASLLQEHITCAIGPDSGAIHLAASQGVPTLSLFGPTEALLYAPSGKNHRSISCPTDLGCNPCVPFKKKLACGIEDQITPCMDAISVETVFKNMENITSTI